MLYPFFLGSKVDFHQPGCYTPLDSTWFSWFFLGESSQIRKARPPAFDAAFPAMPRRGPPTTADECRRVGNDLYRAAAALAQSHTTDVEGITFGAEGGMGMELIGRWVDGWMDGQYLM